MLCAATLCRATYVYTPCACDCMYHIGASHRRTLACSAVGVTVDSHSFRVGEMIMLIDISVPQWECQHGSTLSHVLNYFFVPELQQVIAAQYRPRAGHSEITVLRMNATTSDYCSYGLLPGTCYPLPWYFHVPLTWLVDAPSYSLHLVTRCVSAPPSTCAYM